MYDLQSRAIYVDKNNLEKSLHILQDSASNVQVVILNKYLSKICLKYDRITLDWWFSTKKIKNYDLKCKMNSRNMKNKIKFKIIKITIFTSKTKSSYFLLSITFNDKFEDPISII